MTRIHNIGHIHNANFVQTQFSTSHPQKTRFLKKRHFTFFWKYLVCGFKIEISEYPKKVEFITYTPYKYEVNRTKTHEIRAKLLLSFFISPHCNIKEPKTKLRNRIFGRNRPISIFENFDPQMKILKYQQISGLSRYWSRSRMRTVDTVLESLDVILFKHATY